MIRRRSVRTSCARTSDWRRWTGTRKTVTAAHFSLVIPSPYEALRVLLRVIGPPGGIAPLRVAHEVVAAALGAPGVTGLDEMRAACRGGEVGG
jgi:hypothetical protein